MSKINVKAALIKAVATGGGAVAAASLNKIDFVSKLSPLYRGALKVGLGVFLPSLAKGKAAGMISDFANGILAVGATELANATVFKSAPISIAGGSFPTLGLGATPYQGQGFAPLQTEVADSYDNTSY